MSRPMLRSPYSTSTVAPSRRFAVRVVATVLFGLAAPFASAQDALRQLEPLATVQIVPDDQNERWRERGLAYIDLPLGFRARFDAVYSQHLYSSDMLAEPYVGAVGPGIDRDRTLESRIALTRPIVDGIEFEIAWETRNSLGVHDPMGFGRQTIGARIRISP